MRYTNYKRFGAVKRNLLLDNKSLINNVQILNCNNNGITLIALVVTIIVLLILAGVTLNLVFSDGGIIKRAQSLEETQSKAELLEKIEIIKLKLETDEKIDEKEITPEDFFNALEKEGIISDPEIGGGNVEELPKENEDDNPRYEVTTDDDIVIEVEIPKDVEDRPENIKVEYVGPLESLPPKIKIKNTLATTNSITLEVEVTRIESGDKISYYYKKHTDTEYTIFKEGVTDQTINIEGLEQGQTYIIKIITSNAKGQTIKETAGITLGKLEEGTISILSGPTWEEDGTATLELQTSATVGYMEYKIEEKIQTRQMRQIDDTGWTKYTEPIIGLRHNNIVLVRLTDGTNATEEYYSVEVEDLEEPTVQINIGAVTTKEINVSVTSSDDKSGVATNATYNYYIKKSADTSYPETATASGNFATYKFENLEDGVEYDVKVTVQDRALNEGFDEKTKIATTVIAGATENLQTGVITATSSWVGDGTATVTLTKNVTDETLYIEYQTTRNSVTSGWNKYNSPITGLEHQDLIEARLTDGRNAGTEASVEIKDTENPNMAEGVNISQTTINTNESISVTVSHSDDKSGINLSSCKWIYNTTSTMLGVDNAVWNSASGFTEGQPINLVATAPDKYYLHVLSVDRAGNKTETMSNEVTVNQPVTKITLSKTSASIAKGNSTTIKVTLEPENATNKTVNWTTSNSSRATVSPTQTTTSGSSVTVKASSSSTGSVTITATTADGTNLSATCSVSVYTPTVSVTSISVSPSTLTLNVGSTGTLSATISPSNATTKTYKWSSETPSVATVDRNGKVTAVAPGTATIKATSTSGSKTDTCIVTVNPIAVTGVTLSASSVTLDIGATKTLTATVKPDNATNKNVTWSSSNTSVATVSSTGKITAKAIGQSTITVTTKDGSKKATCSVTVNCSDCNNTGTKECGGKLVVTFVEDARELENVKSCWFCDDNVVWKPRIWVECNTCGYETYTVEEHCCGKTECAKACAEKPCTKTIECTH